MHFVLEIFIHTSDECFIPLRTEYGLAHAKKLVLKLLRMRSCTFRCAIADCSVEQMMKTSNAAAKPNPKKGAMAMAESTGSKAPHCSSNSNRFRKRARAEPLEEDALLVYQSGMPCRSTCLS